MSFRIAITSDPQYPWYDGVKDAKGNITQQGYPPNLFDEASEPKWWQSSKEQILGQYAAINRDANAAGKDPIAAVIINGDLTSTGLGTELQVWSDNFKTLSVPAYPALGNHDYSNYVDDTYNNNRASRMVDWMWGWLQNNRLKLRSVDFSETDGFALPIGRKTFTGSLAYSFNLGSVHCVMLHNYPFYAREWHYEIPTGGQRNYIIKSSWDWLVDDLAHARQRGDAIFVFTHAYSDDQFEPGAALDQFRSLMSQTGVSAVFAGHIHTDCKLIDTIGPGGIPVFRSGAASQQNFLMLDISFEPSPTFTVSVLDSKTVPPSNDKQNYVSSQIYTGPLNVVVGEMAIVGGRMNVGDSNYAPGSIHDDPECAWGIQGTAEKTLGHGFGLNSADKRVVADPSDPSGSCYLMAQVQAADAVQDGTMVVTGGYVADTKGGSALANTQWGSPSGRTQLAAKLWSWMKDKDQYAYLYFWVAPWGAPDSKPFVVTGGEQVLWEATSTRKLGQDTPWGYQGRNSKAVQIAHARTFIDGVHRPMSYFTLYPAQP